MSVAAIVKGQDLFRALTNEEIAQTDRFSSLKRFDRGEAIYQVGSPASHFFVLLRGHVELRLPTELGEVSLVVSVVEPGSLLGMAALLGQERHTATSHCAESCEVLAVEARGFRDLLLSNPRLGTEVMTAVARSYSDRYRQVLRRLQSVFERLPLIS
jgi:CRP-like cAMP-binding protein